MNDAANDPHLAKGTPNYKEALATTRERENQAHTSEEQLAAQAAKLGIVTIGSTQGNVKPDTPEGKEFRKALIEAQQNGLDNDGGNPIGGKASVGKGVKSKSNSAKPGDGTKIADKEVKSDQTFAKVESEVEALRRIAKNPSGPDVTQKSPNSVLDKAKAKEKEKGGVAGANTAETVWLDSSGIRQSQKSISYAKSGGYTLDDIARGFAENPADSRLSIDAVRMKDGLLTSVDNSRPAVLNATGGGQIQVRVRAFDDPLMGSEIDRFTALRGGETRVTSTWGEAVDARIWKQGDQFMSLYPNGSPMIPKVTGAPTNSIWSQYDQFPWKR